MMEDEDKIRPWETRDMMEDAEREDTQETLASRVSEERRGSKDSEDSEEIRVNRALTTGGQDPKENPATPGSPGQDGRPGGDGVIGNSGPDGRRGPPGKRADLELQESPGYQAAQVPLVHRVRGASEVHLDPEESLDFLDVREHQDHLEIQDQSVAAEPMDRRWSPGDPGDKGAPGSVGPRGMPGQDGRDGYGPAGPKGIKGEDGLTGPKGLPGRKGNRGRPGNSGPPGESGVVGDTGLPGHKGTRGPPGGRGMTECQLVTYIRDNCDQSRLQGVRTSTMVQVLVLVSTPPSSELCVFMTLSRREEGPESGLGHTPRRSACPAVPTELVFGLDMSEDVTPAAFERQRSALLSLLEDITVSESNCPTGARVAVVGYNTNTKYLIRFQDYHRKKQLIEAVKNIALERSSSRRHLAAAMRFVGQNVFKRVRSGMMMRKVAVFFAGGPTQDVNDLVTSIMEYRGLNIVPAVIALRNTPTIGRAMEVDDSGNSIYTVLGRDMAADLRKVKNCAICYDPCKRLEQCSFIQEPLQPQQVDVDLVVMMDGSREMQADEFAGAQELLGSVVEQLVVSQQPRQGSNQARVAVVQQSGAQTPKVEFGFTTYQSRDTMRSHLVQRMEQQSSSSALGHTLQYILREVLRGPARRKRVLMAVVGTETDHADRALLQRISQRAQCEGVALFVVTVGDRYSRAQVEQLASPPVQQHLIHVDRLKADEQGYVQRFFRVLLNAVHKGINTYPPPSLRQMCSRLGARGGGEEVFISGLDRVEVVEEEEEEEEEVESFQEQTGGQTQTGQLDVIETLSRGDSQTFVQAADLNAWFYDARLAACTQFWFGGCGGNANRFNTEHECLSTCGAHSKSRPCCDSAPSVSSLTASLFHRFELLQVNMSEVKASNQLSDDDEDECGFSLTDPDILPRPQLHSLDSIDACSLGQDTGGCQNYTMMWFFDTVQSECSRFWYGGCGGNENRFLTQEECENRCLTKSR
ncbi:hypothetical protein INR49_020534 [Caranx melampygus]|nr:hypothetical protein INR49_020534 [Caranx melampygus]